MSLIVDFYSWPTNAVVVALIKHIFTFLGGFGIVCKVQTSGGRCFALKRTLVNNETDLANMKREITIVVSLFLSTRTPNLVELPLPQKYHQFRRLQSDGKGTGHTRSASPYSLLSR